MKHLNNWKTFEMRDNYDDDYPDPPYALEVAEFTGNFNDLKKLFDDFVELEKNATGTITSLGKPRNKKRSEDTDAYFFKQRLIEEVTKFFTNLNDVGVYGSDTSQHRSITKYIVYFESNWRWPTEKEAYYEVATLVLGPFKMMMFYIDDLPCEDCNDGKEHYPDYEFTSSDSINPSFVLIESDKEFNQYVQGLSYQYNKVASLHPLIFKAAIEKKISKEDVEKLQTNAIFYSKPKHSKQSKDTDKQYIEKIIQIVSNVSKEAFQMLKPLYFDLETTAELLDLVKDLSDEEIKSSANQLAGFIQKGS